jgi:hypothetical protein
VSHLNAVQIEVKPVSYVPPKPNDPCPVCDASLGNGEQITVVDGKQEYHSKCFVCFTCQATFGANYWPHEGKPYCLTHYCTVRGLTCSRCNGMIDSGTAMRAMDRLWHMEKCFRCGSCNRAFGADSEFYSDGELPYCQEVPSRLEAQLLFFLFLLNDSVGSICQPSVRVARISSQSRSRRRSHSASSITRSACVV